MKKTRRGTALRQLLTLCDELQRMRTRMADPEMRRDTRARLSRQVRAKSDELANDLTEYRFRGPLGQVLREFRLGMQHFQVLAALLHRHLRSESPAMEGRAILATVFEDSFDVLAGMELLHENSPLRASGLVVLDDEEDVVADVLEARFRISEDTLAAFRDEIAGLVVEDRQRGSLAYSSNRDLLIDLRILHNLYKHRSERIFQQDRWDRVHAGQVAPGGYLSRRIEGYWKRIQQRLQQTEGAERFPALRFFRDQQLQDVEQIMVVHLFFKEIYEGNAYCDAVDLLRLVSASEHDLLRNRRLVTPNAPLVEKEILMLEPMLESRELTGEVHLADWVVNSLFGAQEEARIRDDDQLDWHLYLRNLEDTGSFFRDMEAN